MNQHDAQQTIEDVKARRALFEFLWKVSHDHEKGRPVPPSSSWSDEIVQRDLQRIFFPKRMRTFEDLIVRCFKGVYRTMGIAAIAFLVNAVASGESNGPVTILIAVFSCILLFGFAD